MAAWLAGVFQSSIPYLYHVSAVQNLADSMGDWLRCVRNDVISCIPLTGKYCHRSVCYSESLLSLSSRYSWLVVRSWTGFLFDSQSNTDTGDGCVTDRCLSIQHSLSVPCVSGTKPCWQHGWLTEMRVKDVISCVPLTGKYCHRSVCHSESLVSVFVVIIAD